MSASRLLSILLALLPASTSAAAAELAVPNAGFEAAAGDGALEWHWWSRTGKGSAVRTADDHHTLGHSVCLTHDAERDWAFSSDRRFKVRPGECYLASAWVKVRKGRVVLAVVALRGGRTLSWDIGSARADPAGKWVKLDAVAEIPQSCDRIYVRLVGDGETLAWVDDVALKPWKQPARPEKPKVRGYAAERREKVRERLDRGVVARRLPQEDGREGGIYVGWRLLEADPPGVAFNVYRRSARGRPVKLNARPISETTDFTDRAAPRGQEHAYFVRAVLGRKEGAPSREAHALAGGTTKPYVSIKLDGDHTFQKAGIADLDGDGRFDFVIKQPSSNIDPYEKYWRRSPDTYKLEAYRHDGKFLWRHDLGWAIERGIWYSPYVVFDLDGDGRAEVAVKTGEGDPRDEDGRVRSGPEYL
ncbi:MAG: rhamnogalacturonan lyase family protein, partial [Planctomycetota bacterium]